MLSEHIDWGIYHIMLFRLIIIHHIHIYLLVLYIR